MAKNCGLRKFRPRASVAEAPLDRKTRGAISQGMFADFLKRLTQPEPEQLPDGDARLALTALLVRIARSDGVYDPAEVRRIDRIVSARYGLTPEAAADLRGDAETLEAQAPDTVRFTRAIKDAVPYDERMAVVVALWQVVLVDGERDKAEDALLRLVASLLGVSDVDSALARQKAQGIG
jgi:uncharacterized tellurite resistance protein B-like protein